MTTRAGLTISTTRRIEAAIRTGLESTSREIALLVGKSFKLGGQLASPRPVCQAADDATTTLIARHVQKLLLGYQRPEPGQIRVSAVAHDPAHHARKLPPLPFGERLAITGDRHQQSSRRAGDGVRQELF